MSAYNPEIKNPKYYIVQYQDYIYYAYGGFYTENFNGEPVEAICMLRFVTKGGDRINTLPMRFYREYITFEELSPITNLEEFIKKKE